MEDPVIKKASFCANEIFGSEEQEIAELFFEAPPKEEDDSGEIKEEINEGITS